MRKVAAMAAVAALVSLGGASMASAGEVKGNGGSTPIQRFQAGSICAFSGLDDGTESGQGVQPGVTQSWGQVVKGFATTGGVGEFAQAGVVRAEGPGTHCRGFASGGGGE